MVVLRNMTVCQARELEELRAHLLTSNVRYWLPDQIDRGATVIKAELSPLTEVGKLRTFFKNIGPVESLREFGEDKSRDRKL